MGYSLISNARESANGARAWVNERFDAKWNKDPLCKAPLASVEDYRALFEQARRKQDPAADGIEAETGFAVDRAWLDDLALHTQIVKKKSDLAYPHGRVLYSLLRKYIVDSGEPFITVLETGTARGFSALCMARAIADSGVQGRVVTLDVLPHLKPIYWNCIDDNDGKKSRAELLAPWSDLARMITFLQGDTLMMLPRVGLDRINFAFLDAQHIKRSVLHEYRMIKSRQQRGDIIYFDDVTPGPFDGVVAAVEQVRQENEYQVRHLALYPQRGNAWAVKGPAPDRR